MFTGWDSEDGTEPMETNSYSYNWFYQAECGCWHRIEDDPVNPISSSELEKLYCRDPYRIINITKAGGNFSIDFADYLKTNTRTGQKHKLKRSFSTDHSERCKCKDQAPSIPSYWDFMDPNAPFKICEVSWQTNEFKNVERYVREIGLLQEPLRVLYRVQNVDLWALYCSKKTQLMRIKGQSDIEQRWLFHGTSRNHVENICLYNFDCRISESQRRSHVLGKGTYFALHATYADRYSRIPNQGVNNTRIMFLSRVIVGKYKTGQPHLCKPDGDQMKNIHDSCVDNTLYPRIFVVFNSDQIYPEYILEYGG